MSASRAVTTSLPGRGCRDSAPITSNAARIQAASPASPAVSTGGRLRSSRATPSPLKLTAPHTSSVRGPDPGMPSRS